MSKKIFISYSHKQGEWVWKNLVPCLRAGGAEVIIDRERAQAGKAIIVQMDAQLDAADLSVLVLSPDYFASSYCVHEMERAVAQDPQFLHGIVVPLLRNDCAIPPHLKIPLYVDLRTNTTEQWDKLLSACEATLGTTAPAWLSTRDELVRRLQTDQSVNLVVPRKPSFSRPEWRKLIDHIQEDYPLELGVVDLENPMTASRRALVGEMLNAIGINVSVPDPPEDLVVLGRAFDARSKPARLALFHFDMVKQRQQYEIDLFSSLRYLMTEKRKLVLLIQSRMNFVELLPTEHPLSSISNLKTVELMGRA